MNNGNTNSGQRSRMPPPPGFNHLQSGFSYGAGAVSPRTQSRRKSICIINGFHSFKLLHFRWK